MEERWAELVAANVGGPVSPGSMFGSKGLRTGKKFFAVWWHSELVVKLPADRIEELAAARAGAPFEPMPGRPMNGWVVLDPASDWPELAGEARAFVESLER
jgi:hypothetical protein